MSADSFTNRRAVALLLLAYGLLLLGMWQRWTQPLIDHGREMNLPARLAAGETLYQDVQFLYGPFAPYFNAALYRIFGIHLNVLHTAGAVVGALILLLLYWLARQLMTAPQACAVAALALVTCALKSTGNYVQPYAYAALYGLLFSLSSLACLIRFTQTKHWQWMCGAGLCAGLSVISKPELALGALAAAGWAWLALSWEARRAQWRDGFAFAFPVLLVVSVAFGWILSHVSWRVLLADNHILFTAMPPQLVYFNLHVSGLARWPQSLWFTAAGVPMLALWFGGCLTLAALFTRERTALRNGLLWLAASGLMLFAAFKFLHVAQSVTPFASAVLLLPCVAIGCAWQWRKQADAQTDLLLLYAVFACCGILRSFLNVTATGPYTPFFLPLVLIVYLHLLFNVLPRWLNAGAAYQSVAVTLIVLLAIGMGVNSVKLLHRQKTFALHSPRGSLWVEAEFGEPMAAALNYVAAHTRPEDEVLCLPMATTLNFLSARRQPFFYEILHPGFLTGAQEQAAIAELERRRVPLILLANMDTSEFRDRTFGRDYNQALWQWIEANYQPVARFDMKASELAKWGDRAFFIQAYARN